MYKHEAMLGPCVAKSFLHLQSNDNNINICQSTVPPIQGAKIIAVQ